MNNPLRVLFESFACGKTSPHQSKVIIGVFSKVGFASQNQFNLNQLRSSVNFGAFLYVLSKKFSFFVFGEIK
jgi:hypothetical protein